jgi:hypothetical protein
MSAPRRIAWLLGLGAILLIGGCNLFQPRTPQPPSQGGVPIDYSSPAATLATMASAIEAKAAGNSTVAYLGALADATNGDVQTFIATFDPDVVTAWEATTNKNPPSEWNLSLENLFFIHLPELSGNTYNFYWREDVQHPNDEDPAPNVKVLHRQYELTATPASGGNVEILAIGYADLTFMKSSNGNRWVIARWEDRYDPTVGINPSSGKQSFSALRLSQI